MAYQSLYRRYRPQRFSEVRGQEHLVRALRNAVVEGRVGHAYLFSGPRGTGKTSTARILAKVLNCEAPDEGEPCGKCASCQAIEHGSSFDVHELDAASNNGVEAIRDLINKAALGTPGRTKVYILDEVHMLSTAASNALLKTLEEPPEHVVFVLATTDPQKVLPTIKSRTQHFEVHLLPAADLEALVDFVISDAGLDVDAAGRDHVLRAGGGSARDTLSALDQVVAAGGVPDEVSAVDELVDALCERDTARALLAVEDAINAGRSPRVLGESLVARLRDVFLSSMRADLGRLSERDRVRVVEQAQRFGPAGATRALEVIGDAFVGIQDAPDPRVVLEVALVRLTKPEADHSLEAIVERLERLERGLGPIGAPPPPIDRHDPPRSSPPPAPRSEAAPRVDDTGGEAAPTVAPPPNEGGAARPADQARRELAAKKAGRSPAGPRATAKKPPPRTARAAAPPAPAEPAPVAPPAVAPASGALPTRDDLTLAWGDAVLSSLSTKAKSRFAVGRFLSVAEGSALFGLPNAPHIARCEEVRAEVEAALAAHFGVAVPLRLVVDDDAPAPGDLGGASPPAGRRGRAGAGEVEATGAADVREVTGDEAIDVSELVEADDVATSGVERIAEMFPGARLVEDE